MEDRKRSVKRSLRARLIFVLTLLGVISAFCSSLFSYTNIKKESLEFVDEELSQIANVVINYNMLIPKRWNHRGNMRWGLMPQTKDKFVPSLLDLSNRNNEIVIAPLHVRSNEFFFIPPGISDGFYNFYVSDTRVRALISTKKDGVRFVVARPASITDEITEQSLYISLIEFLVIVSLFIPTVFFVINRMFQGLNKIAKEIEKRDENDLSEIKSKDKESLLPSELDVFINSLNSLFKRVDEGIKQRQRFIANAAHEMRTPLTALSLQSEILSKENLPESTKEKVKQLKEGIERERALMTSLLTLARAQDDISVTYENINVKEFYILILDEIGYLADNKNIDIGIEGESNYNFVSNLALLKSIFINLVSNAIKYTPDEGTIDLLVRIDNNKIILSVSDTGPGIANDLLEHVFEPFYRVDGDRQEIEGTGLGLSIAKAQAEKIDAKIELQNKKDGGLLASLILPYIK